MLVLTRRVGEEILVGHDIRIMLVAIKREKVRIGINAPNSVPVLRQENFARRNGVHRENPLMHASRRKQNRKGFN